jgi:hypothetical protein
MAGPDFFTKSLLRIAMAQGREVLENIVTGQFTLISEKGGRQMTSLSANGKSFSFQVDPKLSTSELLARVEEALEFFDGMTLEQVQRYLSMRPITKIKARF